MTNPWGGQASYVKCLLSLYFKRFPTLAINAAKYRLRTVLWTVQPLFIKASGISHAVTLRGKELIEVNAALARPWGEERLPAYCEKGRSLLEEWQSFRKRTGGVEKQHRIQNKRQKKFFHSLLSSQSQNCVISVSWYNVVYLWLPPC